MGCAPGNQTRGFQKAMMRFLALILFSVSALAQIDPKSAALFLDFAAANPPIKLVEGAAHTNGVLRFTHNLQYAEVTDAPSLDGIKSISIGGWFYPHRWGEQYFFFRGLPEIDDWGRRFFPPQKNWVNLVLGTDNRGFFLTTANGNSFMPFPHVTVNELTINTWHQLVYAKDGRGFQKFYVDGALIHTDTNSVSAGKFNAFHDTNAGEPIRLAMPLGWPFAVAIMTSGQAPGFCADRRT